MDRGSYKIDQFKKDVKNLSKVLHVQKIRILGGEPLLNSDLEKYIQVLRECDLADNIGICTNGILLNLIDEKLLAKLDFLDISLYPSLKNSIRKKVLENIERLLSIDKAKITVEKWKDFRRTEMLVKNTNKKLVRNIWEACYVKSKAHAIYKGYYVKCTASQKKGIFLKKMGIKRIEYLFNPKTDGLSLNIPNLEKALKNYIKSDKPLKACEWCMGVTSKNMPHCQISNKDQGIIKTQEELEKVLDFNQSIKTRSLLKKRINIRTKKNLKS